MNLSRDSHLRVRTKVFGVTVKMRREASRIKVEKNKNQRKKKRKNQKIRKKR
jgi:hypothetical protein